MGIQRVSWLFAALGERRLTAHWIALFSEKLMVGEVMIACVTHSRYCRKYKMTTVTLTYANVAHMYGLKRKDLLLGQTSATFCTLGRNGGVILSCSLRRSPIFSSVLRMLLAGKQLPETVYRDKKKILSMHFGPIEIMWVTISYIVELRL